MEELTVKQELIYKIIKKFIEKNGYSPSYREIGQIAGLSSPATIMGHIETLKEKGYITAVNGKSRTIRLCQTISY